VVITLALLWVPALLGARGAPGAGTGRGPVLHPGAVHHLRGRREARERRRFETSWLGIGLTIATLAICQPLGLAKRRLGAKLGSSPTVGEGTQNLLCGYLAIAVLVGLLANTLFGVWWLDPSSPWGSQRSPYRRTQSLAW
jgi:hypothetical protein